MPYVRRPLRDQRAADRAVVAVADRQHGRIGTPQLRALGLDADAVGRRVASGWLVREHRGAYRLAGAGQDVLGRAAAAVLATAAGGSPGTVTARSALTCRGVVEDDGGAIHLVVGGRRRSRHGLVLHEGSVAPEERMTHAGLPLTTVTRALVDLAACEPQAVVEEAVHEAEVLRLLDADRLAGAAQRAGSPLLRQLAADRLRISGDLRHRLERRFARFMTQRRLPCAAANVEVRLRDPTEVIKLDAVWWEAALAVELDGRAVHATARSFDADRRRDRRVAVQLGLQVVRVTWRHLDEEPNAVAADLRALYAARADPSHVGRR